MSTLIQTGSSYSDDYDIFKEYDKNSPNNVNKYPTGISVDPDLKEYMVFHALKAKDSNYLSRKPSQVITPNGLIASSESIPPEQDKGDSQSTIGIEWSCFLQMPQVINDKRQHSWGEQENIISQGGNTVNDLKDFTSAAFGESLSGISKKLAEQFAPKSVIGAAGIAIDKKTAILYDSSGRRQFNYIFEIAPQTEAETIQVMALIKKFQFFAAPNYNTVKTFSVLDVPHVFKIGYYRNDELNNTLNRIDTVALIDIDVNYSPSQVFSTFKSGFPVAVRLGLSFLELNILTKSFVLKGF